MDTACFENQSLQEVEGVWEAYLVLRRKMFYFRYALVGYVELCEVTALV